MLHGLISSFRDVGRDVLVRMTNDDLATYLWRMNVHKPFAKDGGVRFEPDLNAFSFKRMWRGKQLLELTLIDVTNDDEVIDAETRLWAIISSRASQLIPIQDQIRTALVELISNVQVHSDTHRAAVAAQTYGTCVRIAVGDNGIGVRESLRRGGLHDIGEMADSEVLLYASQAGVSASRAGGGFGLATIVQEVRQQGLSVHLVSGRGEYSIYRKWDGGRDWEFDIPGTIVEVVFERSSN